MSQKILKPTNNAAFLKIFNDVTILKGFINDVVDSSDRVDDLKFLDPAQLACNSTDKFCVPDVVCTTKNGTKFLVEMQLANHVGFDKRVQYYGARMLTKQLEVGEKYCDLKRVIVIVICNFNLFRSNTAWFSKFRFTDIVALEKNIGLPLKKDMINSSLNLEEFIFLELTKWSPRSIPDLDNNEHWALFFKKANELNDNELYQFKQCNPTIEKALEKLTKFNWTKEELEVYEKVEDAIAQEEGRLVAAKLEGKLEGRNLAIRAFLNGGINIEDVARILGITVREVQCIQEML